MTRSRDGLTTIDRLLDWAMNQALQREYRRRAAKEPGSPTFDKLMRKPGISKD